MRYVVIMAGGSGTRLWPLSRRGTPKQLLPIIGGRSLLRLAFDRALRLVPAERVVVVTGAAYAGAVRDDLPELPAANLLGEPEGRDSLNAVAWAAAVLADRDADAVIAHLSADHVIEPVETFVAAVEDAFAVAETVPDALVTLGVVPTSPHTGYGYLHRGPELAGHPGAHALLGFTEKPAHDVAVEYLASGEYWWNSGMFVWRAATLLDQLAELQPATRAAVLELAEHPERLGAIFPALTKISIDYAVMEPVAHGRGTAHLVAVALDVSWRDVGGYASLAGILATDAEGNSVEGLTVALDARDNLLINTCGDSRVLAVTGVEGLVIVATPDATLVTSLAGAEQVKQLVARVAAAAGPEFV